MRRWRRFRREAIPAGPWYRAGVDRDPRVTTVRVLVLLDSRQPPTYDPCTTSPCDPVAQLLLLAMPIPPCRTSGNDAAVNKSTDACWAFRYGIPGYSW